MADRRSPAIHFAKFAWLYRRLSYQVGTHLPTEGGDVKPHCIEASTDDSQGPRRVTHRRTGDGCGRGGEHTRLGLSFRHVEARPCRVDRDAAGDRMLHDCRGFRSRAFTAP